MKSPDAPLNYLVGQVMKKTGGRANPQMVRDLLVKRLDEVEVRDGVVYLIGSTAPLGAS